MIRTKKVLNWLAHLLFHEWEIVRSDWMRDTFYKTDVLMHSCRCKQCGRVRGFRVGPM